MVTKKELRRAFDQLAYLEYIWDEKGYPPLTLTTGWCQVQALNIMGKDAVARRIQAAYWYGQWRAIHDMIGSGYGADATDARKKLVDKL